MKKKIFLILFIFLFLFNLNGIVYAYSVRDSNMSISNAVYAYYLYQKKIDMVGAKNKREIPNVDFTFEITPIQEIDYKNLNINSSIYFNESESITIKAGNLDILPEEIIDGIIFSKGNNIIINRSFKNTDVFDETFKNAILEGINPEGGDYNNYYYGVFDYALKNLCGEILTTDELHKFKAYLFNDLVNYFQVDKDLQEKYKQKGWSSILIESCIYEVCELAGLNFETNEIIDFDKWSLKEYNIHYNPYTQYYLNSFDKQLITDQKLNENGEYIYVSKGIFSPEIYINLDKILKIQSGDYSDDKVYRYYFKEKGSSDNNITIDESKKIMDYYNGSILIFDSVEKANAYYQNLQTYSDISLSKKYNSIGDEIDPYNDLGVDCANKDLKFEIVNFKKDPKIETKPNYGHFYEPGPDYLNKKKKEKERVYNKLDLYRWYLTGNDLGQFMPTKGITRAEVAEILARALIYDKLKGYENLDLSHITYPDVKKDAWYEKAVQITTEAKIFKGTDNGMFEPLREITQAELISTLKRFQGLSDEYEDLMNINNHWSLPEVNAAAKEGWLKLYQDGIKLFDVNRVISREEVAIIANKAFNRVLDHKYIEDNIDTLKTFKDINPNMWSYYEIIAATNTYLVDGSSKKSYKDIWINHALNDEGPEMKIYDIKWIKKLIEADNKTDVLEQIKFMR